MNVTCPAAVSIPCSSSSPCNFVARQSRSANAGPLYSPLPRSSSGGCALSFSTTNFNSRFFQLSYRPRKHNNSSSSSKKVRARISTFYPDEERDGAGSQPAGSEQKNPGREREEPASRIRDPWSADSKARVPWTPQKQQDRVPWTAEKKQTRDFGSSANHHRVHSGSSPSQYKDSYSLNNQQQAFPTSQTLLTSSDYSRKQQTRVIDSSNASRLQNRLPAFKQAAEPDAFGASFFSVGGADAFSSFTPSNTEKTQGHSPEEGRPRDGSVFTSKLEEILNKFRARESGFKQNSFRDDPYEEKRRNVAAPSALQSDRAAVDGFQATRRDANRSQVYDAWKPSRKDIPHPRNRGSVNEASVEEENFNEKNSSSAASAEGWQRGPREDRRLAMGKRNAGGRYITESASVNLSASLRPKPWEGDGGSSPASKVQSPVRNGSSRQAGTCANRSGPSQSWVSGNNPKSLYLELEDGHRSNGGKKLGERGKGTKSLSMSEEDQTLHTQKSVVCKFDLTESDAEDNEDIVSSITLDAEDDGATPSLSEISDQPPSGSYMGVKTESPMPIRKGQIASWHNHSRPDLPFEFQYSYSETPVARVLGYREEPYSPFGPETMGRPWTGGPPLKKSKKNLPVFDSFNPPPKGKKGIKFVQDPGPYPKGQGPKPARSREEILGEPLTGEEIVQLVDICQNENRLLNLGRDGLTHNMLDLIHSHWKRRRVVKIRCIGVPTVDMDNVCFHLEDKTGGKIVYRAGGNVYLFRGRNYNYKDRPVIPLMLWKPPAPVYPKLIKKAPGGLTKEEAYKLRQLGQKVEPLCTLGKNGVYLSLVNDVRVAFKVDELVRVDCRGLNQSDYKKIGAKLRDLVPCVLLSFDDEQILMWKGKASVSADVDNSSRMEAAEGSDFESTEPSASCGVGSAGLSMVDTKTKVLADIAMADGADDEPCSAIEDTKQQSLVVDAIGVEGWSGNASSSHVEIFNSRTAASLPVPANVECKSLSSINDGRLASSCSSEECHAATVTGIINQISSTELAKNDACLEESREHGLPARSEFDSSSQTVFAVEDDMIFESGKGSADYMPEYKQESNAALDTQLGESQQSLESKSMEENKEDKVTRQAALVLEQPSAKSDNSSRDAGAGKEGTIDTHVIVRVDALWDEAIASGIAIQLDDLDTDNDVIVTKASELAKTVPVVGEYTKGLLSKLRVRKENVPRPDDDLRIHFRNLQKLKTQRKLSKRPFRLPRVDVPEKGGLPIEELARLLSIK